MQTIRELIFILDASGSMSDLVTDTIGGFNQMLERQHDRLDETYVTTVTFNHKVKTLYSFKPLEGVEPLSTNTYEVGGMTALYDAIGETIVRVYRKQQHRQRENTITSTLVVIMTDGMENSSSRYTQSSVQNHIETLKRDHDWEFIFLGANIDAKHVASDLGIAPDRASSYHADAKGTKLNYATLERTVRAFRTEGRINDNWQEDIDADYLKRQKKS